MGEGSMARSLDASDSLSKSWGDSTRSRSAFSYVRREAESLKHETSSIVNTWVIQRPIEVEWYRTPA